MTKLCVAIFVNDIVKAKRDIAMAAEHGADIVELRIDSIENAPSIRQLIGDFDTRFILTCRPTWEGGHSELRDDQRLNLLVEIAPSDDTTWVDIELETYRRIGAIADAGSKPQLILSSHDFTGRPPKLHKLILEMNASAGDINKIAWHARSIRDNLEAFEILKTRHKPTIALCMGEAGLISRILAKKFGAFLTFASLPNDSGTAPGQISITDMKRLYRWDSINPSTKVYGVVGSPVAHSMSPAIHNAAFDQIGHDGIYLPLLVEPGYESFKAFMETFLNFDGLDLSGLSITIPHKENALRYLQEKGAQIDPLAQSIGAVNTIVVNPTDRFPSPSTLGEGRGEGSGDWRLATGDSPLLGFSTDYPAILDSITGALNITRDDLSNYRIAVLGAGGTGRTAVAALAHYGATVVIYNRTRDRADALAAEFNGKTGRVVAAPLEKLCDSCCHIFINTTSVGMHPNINASPLGDRLPNFTPDTLVFDTIYNPVKTKLLQQAEAAGAKIISGIEMFLRQAAGQFQAWTNRPAPLPAMRKILESRLAR
jgi:3-dehydroquinate dehydratase/shikimate dehydrogenase